MSNPIQDMPVGRRAQWEAIYESVHQNAVLSVPYLVMNFLATMVACYGLLENSSAVVIGAMIIAMLLGPISGIALALVAGDNPLLRKALLAEFCGVGVVLIISFIIGKLHQDMPLTDQILARTSPNILDLMIALAGGAAGAYATVSPRLSVGLVGVAIATALVPPIATCGICLARGDDQLAFGGFLLFFANFIAIQSASSVVMFLHGYHTIKKITSSNRVLAKRNAASFALLLGLASFLSYDFSKSVAKEQFERAVRSSLTSQFHSYPGVYLADLRFDTEADTEIVTAVLRTPYSFTPNRVAAIEAKLPKLKGSQIELHIRSVITKESTSKGYVNTIPDTLSTNQTGVVGQW